jgi:hypothetical protein
MNPFDRPLAGSYKNVLVEALRNVGNNTLADEFQNGSMKQLFQVLRKSIFIPTIN